uniref:Nicotinamide/nicotinic acid mononucleotide adenylyltransferase 2 n=1 Tax=Pavo cristatus TaxID=9049 RepID=A0A8C9FN24_PAVCR
MGAHPNMHEKRQPPRNPTQYLYSSKTPCPTPFLPLGDHVLQGWAGSVRATGGGRCSTWIPTGKGISSKDGRREKDSSQTAGVNPFEPRIPKAGRIALERARDYLHKTGRFIVIGGIVSPVHDSYGKTGLVSSRHRLTMCQLAVQSSDWIRVDPWECYQDTWQTTCSVLEHHRDLMKRVTGCILSNVNTPSITPVIGQPQNESTQPIYQNNNVSNKPTAAKILGKVGESLSRICCVRPPMERFTFVELRILLLCGSDLLESFCIPGLWNESDMEVIVGEFGIVVVPRDGADPDRIMNHSSILRKYKNNILVVKDDSNHPMSVVSSTKSRWVMLRVMPQPTPPFTGTPPCSQPLLRKP